MENLDDEKIAYARAYAECKIWGRHIQGIRREDVEDMVQYCLRKLAMKWHRYDPSRTRWRTYLTVVMRSAVQDAVKWHYRQHQRLPLVWMDDAPEAQDVAESQPDMAEEIDRICGSDAMLAAYCRMRYEGEGRTAIMLALGIDSKRYDELGKILYNLLSNKEKRE